MYISYIPLVSLSCIELLEISISQTMSRLCFLASEDELSGFKQANSDTPAVCICSYAPH